MDGERGSVILNVLLAVVVIAAIVLMVIPRFTSSDSASGSTSKATDTLTATYQTMRLKAGINPSLLNASARKWQHILRQVKYVKPVGVQKGTAAPAVANKVFLTTKTGKAHHLQAVVKTSAGTVCVLTARGYSSPVVSGCSK